MRYLLLPATDRAALIDRLAAMPAELEAAFADLSDAATRVRKADEVFAPVEQVWHLADLEAEGFGVRIRRLREQAGALLEDFDGDRIANERSYRQRDLAEGIAAFRAARTRNLAAIATISDDEWGHAGTQEGVGPVMLCDLPVMIAEHDAAHRAEIDAWRCAAAR
jgi:hypothetical protein